VKKDLAAAMGDKPPNVTEEEWAIILSMRSGAKEQQRRDEGDEHRQVHEGDAEESGEGLDGVCDDEEFNFDQSQSILAGPDAKEQDVSVANLWQTMVRNSENILVSGATTCLVTAAVAEVITNVCDNVKCDYTCARNMKWVMRCRTP